MILYREYPVFAFEAIRQFSANIIACQMATGERSWNIVGCYLAPADGTTIRDVEAAMAEKPRGTELIVAGDLNVELGKTGIKVRDKEITVAVAMDGLEGMAGKFLPEETGVVSVLEDVVNKVAGKGSEVSDRIHPGVRPSDITELGRPGPKAQLRQFHGRGDPA